MVSVTPVMERNIKADSVLHTDQNHVWVYNYEFHKTNKLTLYNEHFVETKSLTLTYYLYDMALSASQDIIATDYNNKSLVKISTTGSFSTLCNTAPLQPHGICINSRQQLVLGLSADWGIPPIKLVVYSPDGSTVLQEIENDEDGKPLFREEITHVKQNGNGDYVMADGNRIVCVSSEGRFRWDHSEGPLMGIHGMVCDKYDNIIITDHYNDKILLLNSEGKLVTTLLTEDGIYNPLSLSIDRHGQLWVGQEDSLKVIRYLA